MLYSHFIEIGTFFCEYRREIHWTHEVNKTNEVPKTFQPGKAPLLGYRCDNSSWWEGTLGLAEIPASRARSARDVPFMNCCLCLDRFWGRHLPLSHT